MKLIYTVLPIVLLSCGLKANQNGSISADNEGSKGDSKKYTSGFEMKYYVDEATATPQDGDMFYIDIINQIGDTVIFDSKKMVGSAAPIQIMPSRYNGDIQEILKDLSKGDSVVAIIPMDSFIRGKKPDFLKEGSLVTLYIKVVDHKTQKQLEEEKAKYEQEQKAKDEAALMTYFESEGIDAKKAESGYYYVITKEGSGDYPKKGQSVTVNYTGHNLKGVVFDSNVDPKFNHVQPFTFHLDGGEVIRGWDLAFANLRPGAKATIYLPSYMAYGPNPPAGAPFGPNESLVFDVELVSVQ